MRVAEILKSKGRSVEAIDAHASIAEAIGRLNGPPQIGSLIVSDQVGQRPFAGLLTERETIRCLGAYGSKVLTMRGRRGDVAQRSHLLPAGQHHSADAANDRLALPWPAGRRSRNAGWPGQHR